MLWSPAPSPTAPQDGHIGRDGRGSRGGWLERNSGRPDGAHGAVLSYKVTIIPTPYGGVMVSVGCTGRVPGSLHASSRLLFMTG